jgi:protein TonB
MRRLIIISAAVHVGVLILLPILPTLGNEQPLALEVYAVELVELPPPSPPVQEVVEEETAPEPVVEQPPPEEKPIPEEPVRQRKRPVVTPPPKPPEKTLEEKIAERLKSQEQSRPKEESREEKPAQQQPSGSTKITAGKVADYYLTVLQGKITRNWKQPSARFTGGDAITVRVSFTILRNGDITGLKVARASGWSTVDQSAIQAVRSSAPFGALPPTYRDDRLDVTIDFTVTQ